LIIIGNTRNNLEKFFPIIFWNRVFGIFNRYPSAKINVNRELKRVERLIKTGMVEVLEIQKSRQIEDLMK
jgi:hypothetical protein